MNQTRTIEVIGAVAVLVILASVGAVWVQRRRTAEALYMAASDGHVAQLRQLLARGVGVDTPVGGDGATALMTAAFGHHLEAVKLLLAAGADVNAALPEDGSTALSRALLFAAVKPRAARATVEVLLDAGARVDLPRTGPHQPLAWAAATEKMLTEKPRTYQDLEKRYLRGAPGGEIGVFPADLLTHELRSITRALRRRGSELQARPASAEAPRS